MSMTGMRFRYYNRLVDSFLRYTRAHQREIIETIREFVECESPSGDASGIKRMVDLLIARAGAAARVRRYPGGHVRLEFDLPGKKKSGQILALGHSDTVWPLDTLRTMPFRKSRGRLWGPG